MIAITITGIECEIPGWFDEEDLEWIDYQLAAWDWLAKEQWEALQSMPSYVEAQARAFANE